MKPDLNKKGSSGILEGCKTSSRYGTDEPGKYVLP
jgi:hypothetical protein